MTASRQKTLRHFIVACSAALFVAAGGAGALAHGGNQHNNNSGGGNSGGKAGISKPVRSGCVDCRKKIGGRNVDTNWWLKHHHHKTGPGGLGKVHGPGSSHNPIVYHPPKRIYPSPIVHVGPPKMVPVPCGWGVHRCHHPPPSSKGGLPVGAVVHDHRNGRDCSYVVGGRMRDYYRCEGHAGR